MKILINVDVSEQEQKRIASEEKSWNATRLVLLFALTMAVAIGALLLMSNCQFTPLP